jgi:4'-phosphopantetheinyl transferase
MAARLTIPTAEIHIWHADLAAAEAPAPDELPAAEWERAERLLPARARERWPVARWVLRRILARYVEESPGRIELRLERRGKPALAGGPAPLHFNLSHSGDLALVAVSGEREVGIDVEMHGTRAASFYSDWVRKEAIAKCLGVGLGTPPPQTPVSVSALDAGEGYAAAVAVEEPDELPLHRFRLPTT